jgi:hypothetical protein
MRGSHFRVFSACFRDGRSRGVTGAPEAVLKLDDKPEKIVMNDVFFPGPR